MGIVVSSKPLNEEEIQEARTRLGGPFIIFAGPFAAVEVADALLAMTEAPPPPPPAPPTPLHTRLHPLTAAASVVSTPHSVWTPILHDSYDGERRADWKPRGSWDKALPG